MNIFKNQILYNKSGFWLNKSNGKCGLTPFFFWSINKESYKFNGYTIGTNKVVYLRHPKLMKLTEKEFASDLALPYKLTDFRTNIFIPFDQEYYNEWCFRINISDLKEDEFFCKQKYNLYVNLCMF